MMRKIIFCTFTLTALLFSGCAGKQAKGAENSLTSESATPNAANTANSATNAATPATDTAQTDNQTASDTGQHNGVEENMISEEEAKQIALSHAGFNADQVTFIKSGIDRDDGRKNYDVEFYTQDQKEYDYEIDPYTGEVLDYDYDAEYYAHSSDTSKGEGITADEAKQIALAKVPGSAASDIKEFKSDYDNGYLQYEGKIYYEQQEYEFEINGYSGEVVEWDIEPIYG